MSETKQTQPLRIEDVYVDIAFHEHFTKLPKAVQDTYINRVRFLHAETTDRWLRHVWGHLFLGAPLRDETYSLFPPGVLFTL